MCQQFIKRIIRGIMNALWKIYFFMSHSPEIYNPNTWFSGIILFFLLMAIAFLGYILPFGQMSFWGATVITNLFSFLPYLIEWICGGYYIYNPTLKRFFLFHFHSEGLFLISF